LGGAGLTLREMVGLYAGLASQRGSGPLSLVAGLTHPGEIQTEAQRLVADILTHPFPDGGPQGIGWKTGTSWGGRDSWAFGFDRNTVVGVWVGRPDGTPVPGATGRDKALPLLARIFDILPAAPRQGGQPVAVAASPPPDSTLRLLFPPPGAVLSPDGPVTLRAMGGRRPLTFLVDGAPVTGAPAQREAGWAPAGPGFYTITVLDADGLAARAPVRVR
jgi:penicillin-binding protein 1C